MVEEIKKEIKRRHDYKCPMDEQLTSGREDEVFKQGAEFMIRDCIKDICTMANNAKSNKTKNILLLAHFKLVAKLKEK